MNNSTNTKDYPFELFCALCGSVILFASRHPQDGEMVQHEDYVHVTGIKPRAQDPLPHCHACGSTIQFYSHLIRERPDGPQKAGVPMDAYKKKLFRKRLKEAGYSFEVVGALAPGVLLITVETDDMGKLYQLLEKINAEAQASQPGTVRH